MIRILASTLALFIAMAGPATAQIFPGVSADEAEKEIRAAKAKQAADQQPEDRPEPIAGEAKDPAQPPSNSPDPSEQRRFNRLWSDAWGSIRIEQNAISRAASDQLKGAYSDTKAYAQAMLEFHSENFKSAGSKLRAFQAPREIAEATRNARETLLNNLHGGIAFIDAGYADIFEMFDPDRSSQRLLEARIKNAGDAAIKASRVAANLGSRAPYDQTRLLENRLGLEAWQTRGEAVWLTAWQNYQKVKETPWDGDAVWELAVSLYQPRLLELNLRQRLVLRYFIANFPNHEKVTNGEAHVKLAWSLVRTWQFTDATTAIETARTNVTGNAERARAISTVAGQLEQERNRIERGLLNIHTR